MPWKGKHRLYSQAVISGKMVQCDSHLSLWLLLPPLPAAVCCSRAADSSAAHGGSSRVPGVQRGAAHCRVPSQARLKPRAAHRKGEWCQGPRL